MDLIPIGLINLYMSYNGKIGDIRSCEEGIDEYGELAKTSDTPERREYYAKAAEQLKQDLPQLKKEADNIAHLLGLSNEKEGKILTLEELKVLKGKRVSLLKDRDGSLSMTSMYQPGSYISKKT